MRALLLGPLAASALGVAVPGAAHAAVRIVRSGFESRFPESVVFSFEATSSRSVQTAVINYRVAGRRAFFSSEAQIEQGAGTVRGQRTIDLSRHYLPPGADLQFYWVVTDDQGDAFRSQNLTATVEDRRFTWRAARSSNLEVAWSGDDDALGRALQAVALQSLGRLAGAVGITLERRVRILAYPDLEAFRSASFRGGIEWLGGIYYATGNIILLYTPLNAQGLQIIQRALPHELGHAVVHQVTENPYGDVPQWLGEGIATWSEPDIAPDQAQALQKAIVENRLISVRSLSGGFGADVEQITLAYAQSRSLVAFILERYGGARLSATLRAFKEGVTADDGLHRGLGIDQAQLESEWRAWLAPWSAMKATPFPTATPPAAIANDTGPALIDRLRQAVDRLLGRA